MKTLHHQQGINFKAMHCLKDISKTKTTNWSLIKKKKNKKTSVYEQINTSNFRDKAHI